MAARLPLRRYGLNLPNPNIEVLLRQQQRKLAECSGHSGMLGDGSKLPHLRVWLEPSESRHMVLGSLRRVTLRDGWTCFGRMCQRSWEIDLANVGRGWAVLTDEPVLATSPLQEKATVTIHNRKPREELVDT